MIRNILHIGMGVVVVFLGLVTLVELLGYVTWYLMPRDAESMQQASEFEAIMGRLVQSPTEGAIPGCGARPTSEDRKSRASGDGVAGKEGAAVLGSSNASKEGGGEGSTTGWRTAAGKSIGDRAAPSEWALWRYLDAVCNGAERYRYCGSAICL